MRTGLLPEILKDLLDARKQAKKELKEATDPSIKAVLEGRQLALKVSANSVYGFTGASNGQLPCLEISSSVTAFGQEMIKKTMSEVEAVYTKANGYSTNAIVIYGDTDSVMVNFGLSDLGANLQIGAEAAVHVSKLFEAPIKLEFEKVYYPYLLMNKKRYAGVIWTNTKAWDKIDTKGIEVVRRDNCQLVKNVMETVLHKILIERSVPEATEFVKGTISNLLQNKVDLSSLIISKTLSKGQHEEGADDDKTTYKAKQAHTELVERMKKRGEDNIPGIGDRVQYVMVKGAKGSKNYENAEDPIRVLEKDLPIDTTYYLENQLEKPLTRIFEAIMNDVKKELFSGDHMNTKYVPKVKANSAMGKFVKVSETCLNCKVPVKQGAVCDSCEKISRKVYLERKIETSKREREFVKLWTTCQSCQGSLMQEVICQNNDCPIFYKRFKAKKELEESRSVMIRFEDN